MIQARTIENAVHLTAARYHWRHDFTGRAARTPANDRYETPAAYFARLDAARRRQMRDGA